METGMCVGWAWGAAAMASSLAVRSQALLAQQQQEAQASLVNGIPAALQLQKIIFTGHFLDPRSSAVYGAFFFIGTFFLGVLRAYVPKLALLSIFGTIVLDIVLFPTSQYTLAKQFIIPTSYYVAVAITTLIFVFPVSLNHVWITSLQTDFFTVSYTLRPGQGARRLLLAGTQGLLGQIGMIDLEFSFGRLGPGDLKRISNELKSVMFRASITPPPRGLLAFQEYVDRSNTARATEDDALPLDGDNIGYWDRFTILEKQIWAREVKHGHDFDSLVPIIAESSAELRSACAAAVTGLNEWFNGCNSGRWPGLLSKYDKAKGEQRHAALMEQLEAVQKALEQYREVEKVRVIKPFEKFFDPVTGQRLKSVNSSDATEMFAARSLYVCFVFSYAIDTFADRLSKLMAVVVDIDGKRSKPRIWAPSGFGKLGRKLMSKRDVDTQVAPLAIGTSHDPTSFDEERRDDVDDEDEDEEETVPNLPKDKPIRKNPDALPPTTAFGRFFLRLGKVIRFFKSAEGIFAMRHAVVSIALWIPSVCSTTAAFYYGNRGLWALIMAQMGLAVYAGDQIAGLVVRLTGTIFGLLIGMAVWYIGAGGLGDGNPYGVVITTTVFISPFLLGRLAAPPQQMMLWIMTGVTIVFVVGYSWIDTHLTVFSNAGVGIEVGWKRALLVIIGFTAGFIVMMFPQPTSSRTLVRKTLAAAAGELGVVLAVEVEALLAEEARAREGYHEKVTFVGEKSDQKASPKELRVRRIGQKALVVAARLQGVAPSLQTAKLEPQLSGTWPHAKYAALHETQMKILSALMLFIGAFTQLDTKWCSILVHQTPFLNPNLLSDIFSNISIVSYALAGAHPLPPGLPRLRDRVVIITLVDEMAVIIRDLCGEMTFQGFADFQRDFLGREEKAIGGGYNRIGMS
ncbi:hypothetical protein C0991_009513 [Blastosporella zonata]|nr:hypothetical protein C0991_009513 [Blastosporella zonata]